ncbi:uncharacterized protein MKZ38_003146 [Zalerion maritima]|uniref:General stress protein FMN-binding split barrel domain-containing protein n=1 Tax=Zalerion maritima TaxID=339359 RepID=A0AAD5WW69_9PEZI|nr:uncharacterized protein MKZ38_003146 [Zalerion maritima]
MSNPTEQRTQAPGPDPYREANMENQISLKQKVEDLQEFMNNCKYSMMTTRDAQSGNLISRCMALAATETEGIDLIFFTNTQSHKTSEVASDPHVNIGFLNSSGEWASISGTSTVDTDRELVKKHYSASLRAWLGDLGDGVHDGKENDPRIAIMKVRMNSATYSLLAKGAMGRTKELAKGMAKGTPAHVNSMREITEDEVGMWRTSASMVQ